MDDERVKCAGPGCRKKVDMLEAWAIIPDGKFCSRDCYMRHIKKNDPVQYGQLIPFFGVVE